MGDSDDEYDRKRRDKFRGERGSAGDSYPRGADRSERSRGRDDWQERGRPRQDYRDYRPPPRDRGYSPVREGPPMKRMRGEGWGDEGRGGRFGGHDSYGMYGGYGGGHDHYGGMHGGGGGGPYGHPAPMHQREPQSSGDMQTQPCMMTLKQFLATQDDAISDSEAIQKYNDYKLEFKRQQLNEFFVAHKDEECARTRRRRNSSHFSPVLGSASPPLAGRVNFKLEQSVHRANVLVRALARGI
uniref:Serrate RNA effector molecule homolog n=1 Tax=Culex pipiens TaxID=7175 RepID=A0A8D8FIJ2_CULPI